MKSFAETFFKSFGADLQSRDGEWVVELPPDLADAFGKPRLYLVFPPGPGREESRELSPTEDLLVYGSRTFDQMLALLDGRGEGTALRWPTRVQTAGGKDGPDSPLPLHNCRVLSGEIHTGHEPFYIFNFRAVYTSDEKEATFMTIALDGEGQPAPDVAGRLTGAGPLEFDASCKPAAAETWAQMLAQAEAIAHDRAGARAAELEQEIRPRLEKALLRLTGYYRRLTDEVDTGDEAQDKAVKADLQQDLARKIADELERHQLQVTLTPLSYAVALLPFARYRLRLATPYTRLSLVLKQDLNTGQVELPLCRYCGEPIDHLALCGHRHVVHVHCLDRCSRCGRDICLMCGIEGCAICGDSVCRDCVATCRYCERRLCADHVATCAICGAAHCSDHAARCRWCGQSYCQSCLLDRMCETCRQAWSGPAGEPPTASIVAVPKISGYHWSQAGNQAYVVYVGRPRGAVSLLRNCLVIVTDQTGKLLHRSTVGPWQRLFG